MATKNLIDNSSTTVSASTPGYTVDLRYHTTLRLASVGVPVRLKVAAHSTVANDTGAVVLKDSAGNIVLTCLVNGGVGEYWYWTNGYLPATLAKYDLHFQQPATGTLTVYSADVYEIDWTTDPILADTSMTLGALTIAADGQTGDYGVLSSTLDALTIAADGVVASNPPAYQAIGTSAGGAGTVSPAWPTHAVDDIAILLVSTYKSGSDPGAATLSVANGFAAITGASDATTGGFSDGIRITAFWCRATSTSMSAPTVADSHDQCNAVIMTVRGCTTSGNPWDVVTTSTNATSNTSVSITGGTTTVAQTLIVAAVGYPSNFTASSWTNASLSSITERVDDNNSAHVTAATGVMVTAAAYNATTATLSSAQFWAGITIALKP